MIRRSAIVLLAGLMLACGSARTGVFHRVEQGQTVYRIAQTYGVDLRELMEINGIEDPRNLSTGTSLWIPGATRPVRIPPDRGGRKGSARLLGREWIHPLQGTVSSRFGMRNGRLHDGIDILAGRGTPVRAAAYGLVIYAGDDMRGYGNVVVLDHGEEITTLYGHLQEIQVQSGDAVGKGQQVGTVGSTGNATTTHLHFELRVGGEAVDPEIIL